MDPLIKKGTPVRWKPAVSEGVVVGVKADEAGERLFYTVAFRDDDGLQHRVFASTEIELVDDAERKAVLAAIHAQDVEWLSTRHPAPAHAWQGPLNSMHPDEAREREEHVAALESRLAALDDESEERAQLIRAVREHRRSLDMHRQAVEGAKS